MAARACLDCPRIGHWKRGRCNEHERARDKQRGRRQQRGYDAEYDAQRRAWQRRMNQGSTIKCWRCDEPIDPEHWHLGHDDDDRTVIRGPECPSCNLAAAGRSSHR